VPDERTWLVVVEAEIVFDGALQLDGASMGPPAELFFSESGKEALDHVDPRSACRCEVEDESGTLGQPTFDQSGFMRAVVVQNDVHIDIVRNGGFDGVEEMTELDAAMSAMTFADDFAGEYVESCK